MTIHIKQTAANSTSKLDYEKALKVQQQPLTLKGLNIDLSEKQISEPEEKFFGTNIKELKETIKKIIS